ncbi:hypothetical protein I4U23_003572 [Adineta vaga]|nr:hypothetical protein I4U23_003572 [Adineta vaga]
MHKLEKNDWNEHKCSFILEERRLLREPIDLDDTITQACLQATKSEVFEQITDDVLILWFTKQIENRCESINDIAIRLFSCVHDLIDFISEIPTSNIFLIIDYDLASSILTFLDDFSQVLFIYILKNEENKDILLITDAKRSIRRISDDREILFQLISKDIRTSTSDSLYSTIFDFSAEQETTTPIQNTSFIWDYLLIETLFDSTIPSDTARAELVEYCRQQYIDEKIQPPKAITEFEKDYSSEDAIRWYTRDSFLYRLLNKAFRKRDIDAIFKFRFFLVDFQKQLEQCCTEEIVQSNETVYRGQLISELELIKLKKTVGTYISFNAYLSTTRNKRVAMEIANSDNSVLLEIELNFDVQLQNKRFCPVCVQKKSQFPQEEEVILPIGAIFLLESIEMIDGRQYIKLKSLDNIEYKKMIDLIQTYYPTKLPSKFRFADLLLSLGDLKNAGQYIEILMNDCQSTSDPMSKAYTYDLMGRFQCSKNSYQNALSHFERAINSIEHTNAYRVTIYLHIAYLYQQQNLSGMALEYLRDAIKYEEELDPEELADLYDMFGHVYRERKLFYDAISYLQQALDIRLDELPTHKNCVKTYYYIALVYTEKSDYKNSLKYFNDALQIALKALPKKHPMFISLYTYLGYVYFRDEDSELAEQYLEKALDLIECVKKRTQNYEPLVHIFICNVLVKLYTHREDYEARYHYTEKAFNIYRKFENVLSNSDSLKRTVYDNMFDTYWICGDYDLALNLSFKMLDIWKDTDDQIPIFYNIGKIYHFLNNTEMALDYFNKTLELISQLKQSVNHIDRICWINFYQSSIYQKENDLLKAIVSIKEALRFQHQISNTDFDFIISCHLELMRLCPDEKENSIKEIIQLVQNSHLLNPTKANCYDILGDYYGEQYDFLTALECYQSCVNIQLTHIPPCYRDLIYIYFKLGNIYTTIEGSGSDKALFYFEKCRDIYLELTNMTKIPIKDRLTMFHGRKDLTEKHINESVCSSQMIFLVYNSIADYFVNKNNYEETLKYVQMMEQIFIEYRRQNELKRQNRYHFSVRHYDELILNFEKMLTSISNDYHECGTTYQFIALAYHKKQDYLISISKCNIALTFLHNSPFIDHPALAMCYSITALSYYEMKNYDYAHIYYQQAIKHNLLCTPIDYSTLFCNHTLAANALYSSRPWNCNETLKYLLTIIKFKKYLSNEDLRYFYDMVGLYYNLSEKYNSALACYEKAFDYSKNPNDIINVYQQQIYNLMLIGEYDKAYDVTKKSIDCQVSMKDVNFISLLDCYIGAGLICDRNGKYQSALMYYLLTFYILRKHPNDKQNDYYTRLYSHIACVHLEYGEIISAHDLCSKASETHFLTDDKTRIATIIFYISIGLVECKLDNYYVALDYFGQAWEYLYNENHYYHHWQRILYNYIGYVYFKVGQVEIAMKHYIKSLSMYKDCRTHPCRAEVYKNIGLIYEQVRQKYHLALLYYKRALKQITNHKHPHYILYRTIRQLQLVTQYLSLAIGFPILSLGIISNILNILIFLTLSNYKTNVCSFYMLAKACFDLSTLIFGLTGHIIIQGFRDSSLTSKNWCRLRIPLLYIRSLSSYTCLCLQSIDALLCSSRHARLRQQSTIRRAHFLIIGFLFLWICNESPYYFMEQAPIIPNWRCQTTNTIYAQYRSYFTILTLSVILPLFIVSLFGYLSYRNLNPLQFDCLYYYKEYRTMIYQELANVIDELIPYCLRVNETSIPSMDKIKSTNGITMNFEEMSFTNITIVQLLSWSISIDTIERYQFYMNQPNPSLNEYIYNCTEPWFGDHCQYSFHSHENRFISQIIRDQFYKRVAYSEISDLIIPLPCYIHLRCNRGGTPICLDWREICDGHVDCLDEGEDEAECFEMELNECEDDEFRCHNGLCIPEVLWKDEFDGADCLDQSDELLDNYMNFCFQDPRFRCEEHACKPYGYQFSCGDGQCVDKFDYCHNGRHVILKKSLFNQGNLSDKCYNAILCLTEIIFQCDDIVSEDDCPSMFHFPIIPIHFGHIRFLYTNTQLIRNDSFNFIPDYICYDEHVCAFLVANLTYEGQNCVRTSDLNEPFSSFTDNIWVDLVLWVDSYFRPCSIRYQKQSIQNQNSSALYFCQNSTKIISKYRIHDQNIDCYLQDDENTSSSCLIHIKHRIQCPDEKFCLSPSLSEIDCPMLFNTDQLDIPFEQICDRIPMISASDDRNNTDESDCERWPCNNMYSRCDDFWTCDNGQDEVSCAQTGCSIDEYACISPINHTLICLSSDHIDDNTDNCFGGSDEMKYCLALYPTNEDPLRFRCPDTDECLPFSKLCDGISNCLPSNADEIFCIKHQFNCYNKSMNSFNLIQDLFCRLFGNSPSRYFSIHTSSNYPLLQTNVYNKSNYQSRQSSVLTSRIRPSNTHHSWPWFCNRGLVVRFDNGTIIDRCLCPPSYYGDFCQYQNQRVSVTLRLTAIQRRISYVIILLLVDEQNQYIESYDQFVYIGQHSCNLKVNRYLLYSIRPKNISKNYSVIVHVYDKTQLNYIQSWHFTIDFLFLPVNRLVKSIVISDTIVRISSNCTSQCYNGRCIQYTNTKQSFCRCFSGWSGIDCRIAHMNCKVCSNDSICLGSLNNQTICVCPMTKSGPRCLLTSICPSNVCLNGGQCVAADISIEGSSYRCICSENFFGVHCERQHSKLDVSFEQINVPSYVIGYFISVSNESQPTTTIILQKLTLFQRIVTFRTFISYNLVVVKANNRFYLVVIQRTSRRYLSTSMTSERQCPSIESLFNSSILKMSRLRRVKLYHRLCEENINLQCFIDESYLCLCTDERHANCMNFNHRHRTLQCSKQDWCKNQGQCFEDHPSCPSVTICVCQQCFFGNRCQFYTKGFGLTLDEILGYEIIRDTKLTLQPFAVQFSSIMTMIIFLSTAQQRATLRRDKQFLKHFYFKLQQYKHLLLSPFLLVILSLIHISITLSLDCSNSSRRFWHPVNNTPSGVTIDILIRQRWLWRRSMAMCNDSTIATQGFIGSNLTISCASGNCISWSNRTTTSLPCIDYSNSLDVSIGEKYTTETHPLSTQFSIGYISNSCLYNLIVIGGNGAWNVVSRINTITRPDGFINSSPIGVALPLIYKEINVQQVYVVHMVDFDGSDILKCRWSDRSTNNTNAFNECGGVCSGVPGATLISDNCTIIFTLTNISMYAAVAIQIEDYFDSSSTTPMSSVSLQFLLYGYNTSDNCTTPPAIIGDRTNQARVGIPIGFNVTEHVFIQIFCSNKTIIDLITSIPIGMTKSAILNSSSNIYEVVLSWTPIASQYGPQPICAAAVDNTLIQSDQQWCITYFVGFDALRFIQNTISPKGIISQNHTVFLIQAAYHIKRASRNGTNIKFIDAITHKVALSFDAGWSSQVPYSNFKLTIQIPVAPWILGHSYYVTFDSGTTTDAHHLDSEPFIDSTFWTFDILQSVSTSITLEPMTSTALTSKQPIFNLNCFYPRITLIPGISTLSSPIQYRRSQDFTIASLIEFNCNPSLSMTTQWLIKNCTTLTCSKTIQLDSMIDTRLSELYIPSKTLSYGTYELNLTVTMNGSILYSSSSSVYILITTTDITANLVQFGTSMVTSGSKQDLLLDPGTYSVDPDSSIFNSKNWKYTYYCRIYGLSMFQNFQGSLLSIDDARIDPLNRSCLTNRTGWKFTNDINSSIVIVSGSLQSNRTYQFMVYMENKQNSSRQATGYVLVNIEETQFQFINPTTQVALFSICVGNCSIIEDISWKIYYGITNSTSNITQWILFNQTDLYENIWFFGMDTTKSTAKHDLFLFNSQWKLWRFQVTYQFPTKSSIGSLDFKINQPPINGSCSINPLNGTTSTLFNIKCSDWYDDAGIKDYSVYSKVHSRKKKQLLYMVLSVTGWTTDRAKQTITGYPSMSTFDMQFPSGDDPTFEIHLIIYIRDQLNSISEYNFSLLIHVRPNIEEINDFITSIGNSSTNNTIVHLLTSANQNVVGQVISSISKEFNKINEENVDKAVANGIPLTSISISSLGSSRSSGVFMPLNISVLNNYNKELNAQANVREYLMKFTTNLPITTSNSILLQSSTLVQLTKATSQLSRNTLRIALGRCYKLTRALSSMSTQISYEDTQRAGSQLLQCATNLLSVKRTIALDNDLSQASTLPDDYDTDLESDWSRINVLTDGNKLDQNFYYQKQLADEILTKVNEIISLLTSSMNIYLNIEQNYTMNMLEVFMSLEKNTIKSLSNKQIKQVGNAQINSPSTIQTNLNINQTVSIRTIMKPLASYGKSQSHTNLSTSISVTILDENEREVPIEIISNNFIEIIIPRDPNLTIPSMSLHDVISMNSTNHQQLFYLHYINITTSLPISVHVEIHPLKSNISYLLIYKYDGIPQLNSSINQIDGWRLLCPFDLTNESIYIFFLDNQATLGHRSLVMGLRELDSNVYCSNYSLNQPPITNEKYNFTSNYELRVFTSGCYYLDENDEWKSDGLIVGSSTNYYQTQCFSKHLTTFASGFAVLPDAINWKYVFANADFIRNRTIYLIIICVFSIYIILIIYARYKDRKDLEKLEVAPLPDNHPSEEYFYHILVFTGHRKDSGTKSNVCFILHSIDDQTSARILQCGGIDSFIKSVSQSLGLLNCIHIWHDNSGKGSSSYWFLKYLIVRDLQTMKKSHFICQHWLAVEKDDGKIERILTVASSNETNEFSYILSKKAYHSPSNQFTHAQRCTCCFVLFFVSMFLNIMYYDLQKVTNANKNSIILFDSIQISLNQIRLV